MRYLPFLPIYVFVALAVLPIALLAQPNGDACDLGVVTYGIDVADGSPCLTGDCLALAGITQLDIAPGEDIVLMVQYENLGTMDIIEVILATPDGTPITVLDNTILPPGEQRLRRTLLQAPNVEGQYAISYQLRAPCVGIIDTEPIRFELNVDSSLPVELADFTARLTHKQQVELKWRTEREVDNDRFLVERSVDGRQFVALGAVAGAGYAETAITYQYRDAAPQPGTNYYRLRQIDTDGTESLSAVVSASVGFPLRLYPNPAGAEIHLGGFPGGPVVVYDAIGRPVLRHQLAAGAALPVAHLPPGNYWLRTETGVLPWSK